MQSSRERTRASDLMPTRLAIVADFDPRSPTHAATNDAIKQSAARSNLAIEPKWIETTELAEFESVKRLAEFSGIWIGPGSPYRRMEGALAAIRFAREQAVPLLGTCGGFQHIILEYARNVLGVTDAEHQESAPTASPLFISRLACSLVGRTMSI